MHAPSPLRHMRSEESNGVAPLAAECGLPSGAQSKWIFCPVNGRRGNGEHDARADGKPREVEMRAGAARAIRNAEIAICRYYAPNPKNGMSSPLPREDAYLIAVLLQDFPRLRYREDGEEAPVCDLHAGEILICDLRRNPRMLIDKPIRAVYFFIPRVAFDVIAYETNAPRIGDLDYRPGAGIADETVANLAKSLLQAFEQPGRSQGLFASHVSLAVAAHVAQVYGRLKSPSFHSRGGLAPWQMRRAQEFLSASLDCRVSVKEVAKECALSVSHFSRAFRESIGDTPHRWLLKRRVDAAKELMRHGNLHLAEVAVACGFSDQSHLARVFTRELGTSPSVWRRCHHK